MQKTLDFFRENDQYAKHSGIELLEVKAGWARVKMTIQPFHFNGAKTVHGGALFTLADYAFAAAANSRGRLALAINISMSFVKAAYEAEELSLNHHLGTYQVKIVNDKQQLIALFNGTAYRKNEPLIGDE